MRLGHQYVCVRNYFSIRLCIFWSHVVFVFSIRCSLAFSGDCFAGVQRTTVQRRKRSIRNVNIDTLSCIPNERLQRQCLPKMLQLYLRFFFYATSGTSTHRHVSFMFSLASLFIIACFLA